MAAAKKAAPATPAKATKAAPAKPAAPAKGSKAAPAAKPEKEQKAAKAAAPAKEKKVKAERIAANGVKRPQAGTVGDKIWSTADSLSAKLKRPATFEEVEKALEGKDVAEGSLRTGYQRWRKFNGLKGRLPKADK
jgi:hypothetical protein